MSTPDPTAGLGLSEADWLLSGNPTHLVKRLRNRSADRRFVLLACAYALDTPHGSMNALGREIVECVRRTALDAPGESCSCVTVREALSAALAGRTAIGRPVFGQYGLTRDAIGLMGSGGHVV